MKVLRHNEIVNTHKTPLFILVSQHTNKRLHYLKLYYDVVLKINAVYFVA